MKKICKKYRYMFRSDDLYAEMNYMIENLSVHLLTQGTNCMNAAKSNPDDPSIVSTALGVLNSILHIIESILSQEELPDFYEENLQQIATILSFVLEADYPKFQKVPVELIKCRCKAVRLVHIY